jgi:hypothetical protein
MTKVEIDTKDLIGYKPLEDNTRRKVTKALLDNDYERAEIMARIRAEIRYQAPTSEATKKLAAKIGRTPQCVFAIRYGDTRWPTWETLIPLMRELGLRMSVIAR